MKIKYLTLLLKLLNAKTNEVKGEIPSIINLATKTALNVVENVKLKMKLLIIIMINILPIQNLIS